MAFVPVSRLHMTFELFVTTDSIEDGVGEYLRDRRREAVPDRLLFRLSLQMADALVFLRKNSVVHGSDHCHYAF
jgi:hypothetical protein